MRRAGILQQCRVNNSRSQCEKLGFQYTYCVPHVRFCSIIQMTLQLTTASLQQADTLVEHPMYLYLDIIMWVNAGGEKRRIA